MSDWPLILQAQLVGGKLKLNRRKLAALLRTRRDAELTILIEKKHATRSLSQNAWYWAGVISAIAERTGYTPDEVHESMKVKFNAKTVLLPDANGEATEHVIGQSTTKLNKIQFGEYIEQIRQWAAETLDLDIKDPLPIEMGA